MKKIRFWLSKLFFETILKKTPAEEVGKFVDAEVSKWNSKQHAHCISCGSRNLKDDISGSEGLFSSPNHFYRCKDCSNAQSGNGMNLKSEFNEAEKYRLTWDGGEYRYYFLSFGWWFLIYFVIAVGVLFFILTKLFKFFQ